MQANFKKRLDFFGSRVNATTRILKVLGALIVFATVSLIVSNFVPSNPVNVERESIYFLILALIIVIATLYLWNWLNKTQYLILKIEEKEKIAETEKRKKSALGLRIFTIEVWLLLVVSVVFLAFAIGNHDYFGFSIALVALAATALAYFLRRTFDDLSSMNSLDEAAESHLYDFFTNGYLFLPKRIRAGSSENVYLMLFKTQLQSSAVEKDNEGNEDQKLFRVTLDAAGVLTAGDNQRHYSIRSNVLSDYWNCSFPTSGDQVINLRVELIKGKEPPRIIEDVFLLEHYVRVTSLLRDSWEPILVLVPAVVTSISIALMMIK